MCGIQLSMIPKKNKCKQSKNIIRYDDMVKDGDIVIPQDWDLTDEMLEMVGNINYEYSIGKDEDIDEEISVLLMERLFNDDWNSEEGSTTYYPRFVMIDGINGSGIMVKNLEQIKQYIGEK